MRLIKQQNTNLRNIYGKGIKFDINQQVVMDSNNSLLVPKGTTADRPAFAEEGQFRYNTDTLKFEYYENGEWTNSIGTTQGVYYVSKNGSDGNNGKTVGSAFQSLDFALTQVPEGSTIFVKSGDYTINNPVVVPREVGIVGDSLRTVTIRAGNPTQDMFWVNNGSYLAHMTFKDHESPAAAVAFPTDGSAGEIYQSPYVQNCTSLTTTGTGMRVDGRHAQGLKSMVVDAFTQYNQGGIGIHMLYLGNTQLVSVFTICCEVAILCENGGFCSLTNSNSSFGTFGLKADGVSQTKYLGTVAQTISNPTFGGNSILINNLRNRPNVGDAIAFGTDEENSDIFYTISTTTDKKVGKTRVDLPNVTNQPAGLQTARTTVLNAIETIKYDTIEYLETTYPTLNFDTAKCARDLDIIVNSVVDDMALDTNYKTVVAGRSYYQNSASEVINNQLVETRAGINFAKSATLTLLTNPSTEYTRVEANFDEILNILDNGAESASDIFFNNPVGVTAAKTNAVAILEANRDFIEEEGIAYIATNFPTLTYDEQTCRRDIQYIIDALIYDVLYDGNSQILVASQQYYSGGVLQVGAGEKQATIDTFKYLRDITRRCFLNISVVPLNTTVTQVGLTSTTVEIADKVDGFYDIVTNYIESGSYVNDFVEIQGPDFTVQSVDAQATRSTILAAKSKLQVDTIDFLNERYSEFDYDREKCSRDVGLMIDAVALDVALDTNYNSIVAGLSYSRANASVVKSEQRIQTRAAIEFVRDSVLALDIRATAQARVIVGFNEILSIFDGNAPSIINMDTPSNVVQGDLFATNLLRDNKEFITAEIVAYINNKYPEFTYDEAKCRRDIGLILDAVALDMVLNTNYNSVVAGLSYYRANASTVVTSQLTQTLRGIEYIKEAVKDLDISVFGNSRITQLINTVLTIVETGNELGINFNNPVSASQDKIDARNQLLANKTFIQDEIDAWIADQVANNTPPFSTGFTYDAAACRRDVGYIVDALVFDILYEGNVASRQAAQAYFVGTASQLGTGEAPATIAAYERLQTVVSKVILEEIVTRSPGNTTDQNFDNEPGSALETAKADESIQIIIDVINDGNLDNLVRKNLPLISWAASTAQKDYITLINNRSTVTDITIDYINAEIANFAPDMNLCARDVRYIIDALRHDQLYGGNSATRKAALSYFVGTQSQLGENEVEETIDAYEYMASVIGDVVQGISVTPTTGNTETQVITGDLAGEGQAQDLAIKVGYINDVLRLGDTNKVVEEILPNLSWVSAELQSDYLEILTNRLAIRNSTITYLDDTYLEFNYNQTKCSRDVGLITEAVLDDMVFGTNYKSVLAGSSYYRASASEVINSQLTETVAAIEFLKQNALALANDTLPEYTQVSNNFDVIIDILQNGESAIPTLSYPSPTGVNINLERSRDILQANRQFLVEEGIAYITQVYDTLVYDSTKCREDIGYIVDAIIYDVLYGGNSQTANAVGEYYSAGNLQIPSNQKDATVNTYKRLKEVASACVTNTSVNNLQNAITQNVSLPAATSTESLLIEELFDIVVRVLEKGFICEVTLDEPINVEVLAGSQISFHQYSLITASGHTFEWVGAGTNVNAALPYEGGRPILENQVIENNGGRVYYTSTDQEGDFRIGGELTINRTDGTIEGTTFDRSLFAVLTPYILAIED